MRWRLPRLPSKAVNPLTAVAIAVLVVVQVLADRTSWALLVTLGVALGGAVSASLAPYLRKVLQGKIPPSFRARYALTAAVAQGAGVAFVRWCVSAGFIAPVDPLVTLALAFLVGYALTAMMNSALAWLREPDFSALLRVSVYWLGRWAEAAGERGTPADLLSELVKLPGTEELTRLATEPRTGTERQGREQAA